MECASVCKLYHLRSVPQQPSAPHAGVQCATDIMSRAQGPLLTLTSEGHAPLTRPSSPSGGRPPFASAISGLRARRSARRTPRGAARRRARRSAPTRSHGSIIQCIQSVSASSPDTMRYNTYCITVSLSRYSGYSSVSALGPDTVDTYRTCRPGWGGW